MKFVPWLLVAASIGLIVFLAVEEPGLRYATGSDEVEDGTDEVKVWAIRKRASGAGHSLAGKVKEGLGRISGDDDLTTEGATQQVVGGVKDVAGQTAQAIGETIHHLNR